MFISEVKPDMNSILYFFDNQKNFFTKADVYFTHNKQKLKAILLYPFRKEHFAFHSIEVWHKDEWVKKKGDWHHYGLAFSEHPKIHKLGDEITRKEKRNKTLLDNRFRSLVTKLAIEFPKAMEPYCPMTCEVADDYLSIIVNTGIGTEIVASKMETNNYFPHTINDKEFLQNLIEGYKVKILKEINHYKRTVENRKIYVTSIPYENPILDMKHERTNQFVSVKCKGVCQECSETKLDTIHSSIELQLDSITENHGKLIVHFVGDSFVCPECTNPVNREKVVIRDVMTNKILQEQRVDECYLLGSMKDEKELLHRFNQALHHQSYFVQYQEQFWNAFSFIAIQKWDTFVKELTRKELLTALRSYKSELDESYSKEELLQLVSQLSLSDAAKSLFWKNANEEVVNYYLMITVFGWKIPNEEAILGRNRAEFIFRFLPCPPEVEKIREERVSELFIKTPEEVQALHKTVQDQKNQMLALRQENGRLTNKLGEAYKQISDLEQKSASVSKDVRSKEDIHKIHHLKGLIEELKNEMEKLAVHAPIEEVKEEILLTEDPVEIESTCSTEMLNGKKILILGGYRNHLTNDQQPYEILSHDTRKMDPSFYEMLNAADIIVILTRYISHRAMWEAKEFAILEQKPIYYTSFTNIPTIINSIVNK